MTSKYPTVDLGELRTMSIRDRKSKVDVADFAVPYNPGKGITEFLETLPDIFAGRWIRTVIDRIVGAHDAGKPVVVTMGAHVIKCGLSPLLCDLMRRRVITAVAMNGAGAIHDSEIARFGVTSEDVVDGMRTGLFGMAEETADFLNGSAKSASGEGLGFGEALGRALVESDAPNREVSLLATAYDCDVPLTVHACIGCDIVHMHPGADGSAIGAASMRDFRVLTEAMKNLGGGGVLANLGSAVVLPEVVLKAITMLINLGCDMSGMMGVNLDFVQHYRSNTQIVARVREIGGEGISLTGHHELMIPLIAAGVVENLER
ncbi:MAG: GSU2086 family protein [Armatimonadota bacterium]